MTIYYDPYVTEREMAKSGIGWFKFDEPSGSVTDSKGTAVGTLTGATRVAGWNGLGNALNFNGTSNFVQFNQRIVPTDKFSIRFKIKNSDKTKDFATIFSTKIAGSGDGIDVLLRSGSLRIDGTFGGVASASTAIPISDGNWHDVLLLHYGNSEFSLFMDDMTTPAITISKSTPLNHSNNLILGRSSVGAYYFGGQIDDLEIYNDVIDIFSYKSFILSTDGYKKLDKGSPTIEIGNLISPMTSSVSQDGSASASSEFGGGVTSYQAYRAFDGVFSHASETWLTDGGAPYPIWLMFEFKEDKVVGQYGIYPHTTINSSPKDWTFEGSDDGVDWTILDTRVGVIDWIAKQEKIFTLTNRQTYKKFRLLITANNGGGNCGLGELKIYNPLIPAILPSWKTVSSSLPTLPQFQTEGMDDLSIFDRKVQAVLESPQVMTSEVLGEGKVFKGTVDLKKIFDLRKLEVK